MNRPALARSARSRTSGPSWSRGCGRARPRSKTRSSPGAGALGAGRKRGRRVQGGPARHASPRRSTTRWSASSRARSGPSRFPLRSRRRPGGRPAAGSGSTPCCAATRPATGLLAEFIMEEASSIPNAALRQVLRAQGPHVDRMMAAVAAEYMSELELMRRSPAQRVAERVQRLLAGDSPLDAAELGLRTRGLAPRPGRHRRPARRGGADPGGRPEPARPWSCCAATTAPGPGWAGSEELAVADVERYLSAGVLGDVSLAVGEPRQGLEGWRLTHHEAQAARSGDDAPAAAADPGERRGAARRGPARRAAGRIAAPDLSGAA